MWDNTDFKVLINIQELLGKLLVEQDITNSLLRQQLEVQNKILASEQEASDFFKNDKNDKIIFKTL